jgi:hypothetical protein
MTQPTLFISYSHQDEAWKDRVATHLRAAVHGGILDAWDDRRIAAGGDWYAEIEAAMEAASVALLLVSADFLASRFVQGEELPRLLERWAKEGLRAIPVILRPCDWRAHAWLARLQARPAVGRPLSAGDENRVESDLAALAREVRELLAGAAVRPERVFVPLDPERVAANRLPVSGPDLFGRTGELARLDAAWDDPGTNVVSLVAWGGVGKTALANHWLAGMAAGHYRGARRVYTWSFYSQGSSEGHRASADLFIASALAWFGDPDPTAGSPWDKGERLAELVRRERTLLALDGLEPLQYPPGPEEGRLKDPARRAGWWMRRATAGGRGRWSREVGSREVGGGELELGVGVGGGDS